MKIEMQICIFMLMLSLPFWQPHEAAAQSPIWKTYHDMGKQMFSDSEYAAAEKNLLEAIAEAEHLPHPEEMLKQSLALLEQVYRKLGRTEDADKTAQKLAQLTSKKAAVPQAIAAAESGTAPGADSVPAQKTNGNTAGQTAQAAANQNPLESSGNSIASQSALPINPLPESLAAAGATEKPPQIDPSASKPAETPVDSSSTSNSSGKEISMTVSPQAQTSSANVTKLTERLRLNGHIGWLKALCFAEDNNHALSASEDKTARYWDIDSGKELQQLQGHEGIVTACALAQGQALTGGDDKTVRLWSLADGKELKKLSGHSNIVNCVVFSQDSKKALSGCFDGVIRYWDLEQGSLICELLGHKDSVKALAVSADGSKAVSGGDDNKVRVWDLSSGKEIAALSGHSDGILTVSISQDGKKALSSGKDTSLILWDLENNTFAKRMSGHSDWVLKVTFSADGQKAISGSLDKTVKVWNIQTGENTQQFQSINNGVWAVAFSKDGHTMLSGTDDKSIRVWALPDW